MTLRNLTMVFAFVLYAIVSNSTEIAKAEEITGAAATMRASEAPSVNACGGNFTHVSMIQLIANPEKFHGKCVLVVGFVHFEFEGNALYFHEHDYEYLLTKNALWLSISKDRFGKEMRELNSKYVLVEGTFNAHYQGHLAATSGAIENITRLAEWIIKRAPTFEN